MTPPLKFDPGRRARRPETQCSPAPGVGASPPRSIEGAERRADADGKRDGRADQIASWMASRHDPESVPRSPEERARRSLEREAGARPPAMQLPLHRERGERFRAAVGREKVRLSMRAASVLMLPGLGKLRTGHWQTLWERRYGYARVVHTTGKSSGSHGWVDALDEASRGPRRRALVAHSLACATVGHWSRRAPSNKIVAALLVLRPTFDCMHHTPPETRSSPPCRSIRSPSRRWSSPAPTIPM